MTRTARRAWSMVVAGTTLFWVWLVVAAAIFGDDERARVELWESLALIPLLVGAAGTAVAGLAGAADPARRRERWPLRLAALAGLLEGASVVWGFANDLRGSEDEAYALLLAVALLLLPLAGAWGASVRRFARSPEAVREPIDRRFRRGWREATRSWLVMASHSRLLVLPAVSLVLGIAEMVGGFLLVGMWVERTMPRLALTSFVVLLPGTLVSTFFGTAYLAALDMRLRGRPATVADGLRVAWRRRRAIAGWAVLAAGVGAALQALQQLKSEWAVVPLLSWLAGVAWSVLTLFVLPVLALEDLGVRDSIRRAGAIVRARWGRGWQALATSRSWG